MKWFYIISAAVVAALSLAPFYLPLGTAAETDESQVVLYNIYSAKVRSIDPATCGDTTSTGVQGRVYEGLYNYHYLKRPLEVVPMLAAGPPEISDDGLTYTIRLKEGVKYHRNPCFGTDADGKPQTRTVRAEDFVLAFKRIADYHLTTPLSLAFIQDKIVGLEDYRERTRTYEKGDFSRYWQEEIEGVRALDEHTLQFRLTQPYPQFRYVLAMHVYAPIPREVIEYHLSTEPDPNGGRRKVPMSRRDPEIHNREAMVGTGAYVMTHWTRGSRITYRRNRDFREAYYPQEGEPEDAESGLLDDAGKRIPFIDVIELQYVPEDHTAWLMFEHKRRDYSGIPQDVFAQVISPDDKLENRWRSRGIRLEKSTYPAVYWIGYNMNDEVLGNSKSLRQALMLGFNVEQYIDVLHNGRGQRAVNTVPSTFEGHDAGGPSPYARFDLDAAREKLWQAKEELVAAGVIEPGDDIPTLTLELGGRDEQMRRVGEFVRGQFRQIGVRLDVELNDWPILQGKVHNNRAQMWTMGWHADYPDAQNFLQLYYSKNIERGTNSTRYSNEEFDRLYEQAANTLDEQERIELYGRMIGILNEDCPMLLLSEPISYALLHPWVHNFKPHPIGYGYTRYLRLDDELRRELGGR
ncbi:MAG: ABC transporter substrate-binding protein [Phycisphaerae bacterium]